MWNFIIRDQNDKIPELLSDTFTVNTVISPIGLTALHLAAAKSNAEVAQFLIDNGAEIESTDNVRKHQYRLTERHCIWLHVRDVILLRSSNCSSREVQM